MRLIKVVLVVLLAMAAATVPGCSAPHAFAETSITEARARAASEHRLLLVDSTASWCPPCKKMDETTWTDAAVIQRLRDKFIAIQIDVDQQKELAQELNIEAMPTLIVFSSEGKELDRAVGYKDPAKLLGWLDLVADGKREIDSLAKAAQGNDVSARMQYARALVRDGKTSQGAAQYVWIWDNMLALEPSMYGVRHSYLVRDLQGLFSQDPSTQKEFAARAAALKVRLGKSGLNPQESADWRSLGTALGLSQANLEYALMLPPPQLESVRLQLFDDASKQGNWRAARRLIAHPLAEAKASVARFTERMKSLPPEKEVPDVRSILTEVHRDKMANIYWACQATGDVRNASAVRSYADKLDPSPEMRELLAQLPKVRR